LERLGRFEAPSLAWNGKRIAIYASAALETLAPVSSFTGRGFRIFSSSLMGGAFNPQL
jgi:hypothetical protein